MLTCTGTGVIEPLPVSTYPVQRITCTLHDLYLRFQDEKMPVWPVYMFNALNMVTGCATVAVAKQLFNPANFMVKEKDVRNLPSWYASNYGKSIAKVGRCCIPVSYHSPVSQADWRSCNLWEQDQHRYLLQ